MRVETKVVVLSVVIVAAAVTSLLVFSAPPPTSMETIVIQVDGVTLTVEVADTPQKQERGLMFREHLPEDRGMLFVFERAGRYGFWMKNVRFPLDIFWFDENRKAVFIARNLEPCNTPICPVYTPDRDASYVLEVNAGFVDSHRIGVNSTFSFVM